MDNIKIGENIKKFRKIKGVTQKELGSLIGKTESSIQKYECGSTEIPLSVLELIADSLDLHILDLLDDSTVISLFDKYDKAALNYLKALGYEFKFENDFFMVCHNNHGYKIPAGSFIFIEDQIRCEVEKQMEKLMDKYSDSKFNL